MKKDLRLILSGLILWLAIVPAIAQTPLVVPDSMLVTNVAQPVAPDTSQTISPHKQPANSLTSNRIPVKAGDSISVSAMVLDNRPRKGRFWKSLAKAVVPAFILNNVGNGKPAISADHQLNAGNVTTFGVSIAVIPGAIDLLQAQKKAKTFVSLTAYDADNQPVAVVSDFMTKAARKDWEELRVGYRVEKDGFVEITGNKNNADGISAETYGKDYWIKAGIGRYTENEPIASDTVDTGNNPSTPSSPPQQIQSAGQSCTAWYWVDGGNWDFIGITCEDNIDGSNYNDGNYSGGSNRPGCAECKRLAQNVRDTRMTNAKYILATNLALWCPTAAASAGFSAAQFFAWVNAIPEAGQVAEAVIALIGGTVEYVDCAASHILSYREIKADADNNYYKDSRDCEEKYTDCR